MSAPSPSRATQLRLLLPHIPSLLTASTTHLLSLSSTSPYWDLKSTVIIALIKSYLSTPHDPPLTVEQVQRNSMGPKDKVGRGMWKVDASYGVVSDQEGTELEAVVRQEIERAGGQEIPTAGVAPLTGEWIGARPANTRDLDTSAFTEAEKYERLMQGVDGGEEGTTVLWLHGGAYFLLDPATHRPAAARFAGVSKSRVFLPRYRLAPQDPFPAALIDALQSYLFLLYPPPGSLHKPVAPSKLVLAGDSAGGGLALSLLLLVQALGEGPTPVLWHDTPRTPPLPAGVASLSPWVDLSRCFGSLSGGNGSEEECVGTDYLTAPLATAGIVYADSPAWNAQLRQSSKRTVFYAPDHLISNPYVSPILAEKWPEVPHWVAVGDECLRDQALWWATRLPERRRVVRYESMPHVFMSILTSHPASAHAWEEMAGFVHEVTKAPKGGEAEAEGYKWESVSVHPKRFASRALTPEEQRAGLEMAEVGGMVERAVVRYREIVEAGEKEGGMGTEQEVGGSKL